METMETMEEIETIEKNTILIADDAEINREMIKFIFDEQYNIIEAENGEQAIEIIKKDSDKLCLLFLDLLIQVLRVGGRQHLSPGHRLPGERPEPVQNHVFFKCILLHIGYHSSRIDAGVIQITPRRRLPAAGQSHRLQQRHLSCGGLLPGCLPASPQGCRQGKCQDQSQNASSPHRSMTLSPSVSPDSTSTVLSPYSPVSIHFTSRI